MPVIDTPRLRLRPFTPADGEAHARLYADPEVTRHLPGGPFSAEEARVRSRRAVESFVADWAQHGFGVWALMDRASGAFVGQCGIRYLPGDAPEVELLYALERARWGSGLATEAGAASLRHGFGALSLPRIVAVTRPEHGASRRVMEKLGLHHEKDVEVFGLHAVYYVISREDFLAASSPPTP